MNHKGWNSGTWKEGSLQIKGLGVARGRHYTPQSELWWLSKREEWCWQASAGKGVPATALGIRRAAETEAAGDRSQIHTRNSYACLQSARTAPDYGCGLVTPSVSAARRTLAGLLRLWINDV